MCESSVPVTEIESTIYLIRHGARYDFANPSWKDKINLIGGLVTDPPLSSVGHEQARERAFKLANVKVDRILASPYLRTIQTAVPFSENSGVQICIENGLAEAPHVPGVLPLAKNRYLYFPHVDVSYESILNPTASPDDIHPELKKPQETIPVEYFKRMWKFAGLLGDKYIGKTVICFSHAASLALVAAFLNCDIDEIPGDANSKSNERTDLFAPLGVYKLVRKGTGKWNLVINGSTSDDLSCQDANTYPWGYERWKVQFGHDAMTIWKEMRQSWNAQQNQ